MQLSDDINPEEKFIGLYNELHKKIIEKNYLI